MIKIIVNNKPMEVQEGISLLAFANFKNLPEKGVAIALNNNMVHRSEWESTVLKDNDDVIVIKADCGG